MPANPISSQPTPTTTVSTDPVGPLAALESDPYSLEKLQYPIQGLGQNDVPHYVTFYINLPTQSKYIQNGAVATASGNSASTQNYDLLAKNGQVAVPITTSQGVAAGALAGGIATLSGGGDLATGIEQFLLAGAATGVAQAISLRPKLQRIAKTISIYMPDTLVAQYDYSYEALSLTEAMGDLGKYAAIGGSFGGVGSTITDALKTTYNNLIHGKSAAYNNARQAELAGTLAEKSGLVGGGFTDLALKSLGKAINPQVEMLFRGVGNRRFEFIFNFQARSQQEAVMVYDIIKTFKAYAAPEIASGSDASGRYFIPPAQWDIKFYFMNKENPAINKVSTCSLETVRVNYAGSGQWSTFDDGNPVHIELNLQFVETDIITRELITQFGY